MLLVYHKVKDPDNCAWSEIHSLDLMHLCHQM